MDNLIDNRLSFIGKRQTIRDPFSYIFCAKGLVESCIFESAYANAVVFPLYLKPSEKDRLLGLSSHHSNFSDEFIEEFSNKLGLEFAAAGENADAATEDADTFTPEAVFHYAYAVFHSPTYRARYAEFLKIDFPRLPLTTDTELFRGLCALGAELVALHLLEDGTQNTNPFAKPIAEFHGVDKTVARGYPKYDRGDIEINASSHFEYIPEEVWDFHIGGYQVAYKWLKDRRERTLSDEDISHYCRVIIALNETIRLMSEIDETIEEHGGYPLVGSQDLSVPHSQ